MRGLRGPKVAWALAVACERFGVSPDDLRPGPNSRSCMLARSLAVCLLRARWHWSWEEIGRALGITNSTAIHAFRRQWGTAEQRLVWDAYLAGLPPLSPVQLGIVEAKQPRE